MSKLSAIITVLFFSISNMLFSQGEGNIWYFGEYAGLNFNSGQAVAITNSGLNTIEGSASICDNSGNILFYTNGVLIYDSSHSIMQNGTGLLGDESSTQSSIIVPNPLADSLYYIFTVGENGANGLRYSEVNMSLNNGLGGIIAATKNTILYDENNSTMSVTEKITSVKHADNSSYWIIAHEAYTNKFYVYLINYLTGFNTTPTAYSVGSNHVSTWGATHGYMKASPGGEYLGLAVHSSDDSGFFEVFDFNNSTGEISNPRTSLGIDRPYGVEFSADATKFYGTSCSFPSNNHPTAIRQFDVNASNFAASVVDIQLSYTDNYMGMQLGPDGKIYVTRNFDAYLGVINNPNEYSVSCNFVHDGIYLNGKTCRYGLPTFIQSYFKKARISVTGHCTNSEIAFDIYDSEGIFAVEWNFDDPSSGSLNLSNLFDPVHIYAQPGTYSVSAELTYYGFTDTIFSSVTIFESPDFTLGNDTAISPGTTITLSVDTAIGNCSWSTGEYSNSIIISQAGTYNVTVSNQWECEVVDEINIYNLSVENLSQDVVYVYPNPCTDYIHIKNNLNKKYTYELLNINAEVLKRGHTSKSLLKLDIRNLPNGIYILKIEKRKTNYNTYVLKISHS